MHIRDRELERLRKYAEGLGLKIEYRIRRPGHPRAMVVSRDGISEKIIFYKWKGKTKTDEIVDYLHELAHHVSWIYKNRKDSPKLLEALLAEDDSNGNIIDKEQRKLIYICEKEDAEYQEIIAHEVDIQIPKWKLKMHKYLDVWIYKMYYLNGTFPIRDKIRKKKKQLMEKFKNEI